MSDSDKILQYLDQVRPVGTDPVEMFSPKTGQQVVLRKLYIANLTSSNHRYSLYFDNDGSDTTISEAIAKDVKILKNTTIVVELEIPMRNSEGTFSVETDSGNDLNFTLFGDK